MQVMNEVKLLNSPEELLIRDYRDVAFYEGDIFRLVKLAGWPSPIVRDDSLGDYYVVGLLLKGVPVQLMAYVPFADLGFALMSDPCDREAAISTMDEILSFLGCDFLGIPV